MSEARSENAMPGDVRDRLFRLRCRSKEGRELTAEDIRFCRRCLKDYPKQYEAMSREVFEATKPFGSW